MAIITHKIKVPVLGHFPVIWEDVLGLDVVAWLFLRLVVVVVLLLTLMLVMVLGRLVGVLLVKVVHEGRTHGLLRGGVPWRGEMRR